MSNGTHMFLLIFQFVDDVSVKRNVPLVSYLMWQSTPNLKNDLSENCSVLCTLCLKLREWAIFEPGSPKNSFRQTGSHIFGRWRFLWRTLKFFCLKSWRSDFWSTKTFAEKFDLKVSLELEFNSICDSRHNYFSFKSPIQVGRSVGHSRTTRYGQQQSD